MFFRAILFASLSFIATAAPAQNLPDLAAESAFVNQELHYLKRKFATSVYASKKSYCPSLYWWSSRPSFSRDAKKSFKRDLGRRMKEAGFSEIEIAHCVSNSDFIIKNGKMNDHPKHDVYRSYVQSAIMMVRDKSTNAITQAPTLVETYSYTGKTWNTFDRNFSKQCSFTTSDAKTLNMSCNIYGKLKGRYIDEGNGRYTLEASNAKYQIVYLTRRTQSYARSRFAKLIN